MFAEAIERFEANLNFVENAQSVEPDAKDVHNNKFAEETRTLNADA